MVANDAEGLKGMIRCIEKYCEKNKMMVNVEKTKVMIFRKGGKYKDKKWEFNGEKMEVVNNFKYLGYWFTSRNSIEKHIREVAARAQKAINATWGVMKRAGRHKLKNRMYLMNSLVGAGALYGVEVWAWENPKKLDRMQSRYCKMAMGLARNTPKYIWKNEARVESMEYVVMERGIRYIKDILKMDKDRWPRICLKQEMRNILNRRPSKWGNKVREFMEKWECIDVVKMIIEEKDIGEIMEKLYEGLRKWKEEEKKENEKRIRISTYNSWYKDIRIGEEEEVTYWDKKEGGDKYKEIWARLRCGNIGRAQKKGQKDWKCRICNKNDETLVHLVKCEGIGEEIIRKHKSFTERLRKMEEEAEIESTLKEVLKGNIDIDTCAYFQDIEGLTKEEIGRGV